MKSLLVTAALSLLAPVARAQQTDAVSFEEVLEIRRQFEALDAEFDDSTVASGTEDAPSNFPADALLVPPEILASEQGADALFEAQLYARFQKTKCLAPMLAGLSGSAESLGLENQSLIDLLSLRLRNDVSSVPLCGDIYDEGLTWVFLSVTGVGNDFPVAFYVELRVSVSTEDVFESATLGYGSKTSVEEQVEESVRDLVESFGIAFLKGRGEWWSR